MPDLAGAYRETRETMIAIGRGLDEPARTRRVPACPDWTVRDLLAHVTGIAADLVAGDIPADLNLSMNWDPDVTERREALVDEGLEERRDRSLGEILDEWGSVGPKLEAMLAGDAPSPSEAPPFWEWVLVTDVGVHLHDLRGALGQPGDRDSLATGLALRSYVEGMRLRSKIDELPPMRIVAGPRSWTIGDGDPVATLTADAFELQRAASGRRSPEQIRALEWDGDPTPFIDLFYPYGRREEALVE